MRAAAVEGDRQGAEVRASIEELNRKRDEYLAKANKRKRAERRENWPVHLSASGFQARHIEHLRSGAPNWPDPQAVDRAREIICRRGGMLLLAGTRGPGKTEMATQFTVEIYLAGVVESVIYITAKKLCEEHKKTWDRDRKFTGEAPPYDRARKTGLLVLDEIQGAEADQLTAFEDIIDFRYGHNLRTILIGNADLPRSRAILGESVWSRMTEVGGAVICDWPSFRTGGQA